jgi:hypothetical protein
MGVIKEFVYMQKAVNYPAVCISLHEPVLLFYRFVISYVCITHQISWYIFILYIYMINLYERHRICLN